VLPGAVRRGAAAGLRVRAVTETVFVLVGAAIIMIAVLSFIR
jgi:hypothetical protein